jgi:hypothetical protein
MDKDPSDLLKKLQAFCIFVDTGAVNNLVKYFSGDETRIELKIPAAAREMSPFKYTARSIAP